MFGIEPWELGVLGVSVYVAVVTLVRLMRLRRDQLIADLREKAWLEQQRLRAKEKRERAARAAAQAASRRNAA